ncbi:MAG: hypothetical protein F6J93_31545 [Oscillatoria sp. SIO1A7]|nr:hypothetical protein [Oscillatoria sp. SIO1A7]
MPDGYVTQLQAIAKKISKGNHNVKTKKLDAKKLNAKKLNAKKLET